jgi:hypothetical protein
MTQTINSIHGFPAFVARVMQAAGGAAAFIQALHNDAVVAQEKRKKLNDDLRRQLKEEIGDDEGLLDAMRMKKSNPKLLALQHKFGLSNVPIGHSPVRELDRRTL